MSCDSQRNQVALLISILGVVVAAPWQGEQCGAVTRWASWGVTKLSRTAAGVEDIQALQRIWPFKCFSLLQAKVIKKSGGILFIY